MNLVCVICGSRAGRGPCCPSPPGSDWA